LDIHLGNSGVTMQVKAFLNHTLETMHDVQGLGVRPGADEDGRHVWKKTVDHWLPVAAENTIKD